MKKSTNGISWSPAIYLLLAGVFALASIYTSKLTYITFSMSFIMARMSLRWVFWLTTILALLSLIRLIMLALRGLHERNLLPKPLEMFYQDKFRNDFARAVLVLKHKASSLGGQLTAVGLGILIFVAFISSTHLVRDRDVNSYLNEYALGLLGRSGERLESPAVLQLQLFMASHDVSQYLKNCETIVRDLENVGAKAVLIDIRTMAGGKPQVDRKLLEQLARSEIVVFGTPTFYTLPGTNLSRGIYTLRPFDVYTNLFVVMIQPAGDVLRDPDARDAYADVTLELLRKYNRYPSDLKPKLEGSSIAFGDFRIPLISDQWMYSRDRWGEVAFWPRIYVNQGFESDTVKYRIMRNGVFFEKDLKNLREEFKDKIFLVSWSPGSFMENFMYHKAYAAALQNIIRNSVLRKVEMSPLWLCAICVTIAILIARRFRPLVSVLLIFLFGVVVLFADSLLLDRMNVFIEIIYPLLSILLTMMIFPAVSFVHRLRNAGS
jgi:hypothetical protein